MSRRFKPAPKRDALDMFSPVAREALASGIPEDELFTPILRETGERVVMRVTQSERIAVTRGPGRKGIVCDRLTGKRYVVYGRACNLPNCYCDAEVVEVAEGRIIEELERGQK